MDGQQRDLSVKNTRGGEFCRNDRELDEQLGSLDDIFDSFRRHHSRKFKTFPKRIPNSNRFFLTGGNVLDVRRCGNNCVDLFLL